VSCKFISLLSFYFKREISSDGDLIVSTVLSLMALGSIGYYY